MVTFIHTADWQLGKPFARVEDVEKRSRLKQERLDAVRRIGDVVRQTGADFVVVAGDLFDSAHPTKATVSAACDAIASIQVPVFVIPGNHDHGGPECVWEQRHFAGECRDRAPNLRILLDEVPVEIEHAVLLPSPLHRRHSSSDPCTWISGLDFGRFGDRPRIVIAHGSTVDFSGESDEEDTPGQPNFIDLTRLPTHELDYVALGDWHGFTQAGPKAWYSGSHETDRFPRSGQVTGHVACVRVGRGTTPLVEPHPTGRTRWLVHDQTFSADTGPELLDATLNSLTGTSGPQQVLLKLAIDGSLGLAAHSRLDDMVSRWQARLLDMRLLREVGIAPSQEEIDMLVRADDPLISRVAADLVARLGSGDEAASLAGTALALLHDFAREEENR